MTVREEADYRSAERYRLAARGTSRFGTTSRFYIGVDLGQKQDHTAIAVVERREFLLVRHVERVALGTPYPLVVAHLREMVSRQELRGQCALVVDGTGLGGPVVEMLRGAGLGCEITAVTITGGERERKSGGLAVSVPKRDLIAGVQVALDNGDLRIARKLKELGSLVRELVDVRMTSGPGMGRVRISADGYGEHDDLVIALALACWRAKRRENGERGGRLL
jgi:phage FluMu gp28-like protein